ncbi:hypothetical protein [Mangrovibacterium lignilyticum]|uniref:hypothetical protein n=1 Tax=Mangrovibacterium lignilyticum TaxID=2668052 RepID=UPI0013D53335|nr:hypothetical protein [Mangrovibacterium lignilyticum]
MEFRAVGLLFGFKDNEISFCELMATKKESDKLKFTCRFGFAESTIRGTQSTQAENGLIGKNKQ